MDVLIRRADARWCTLWQVGTIMRESLHDGGRTKTSHEKIFKNEIGRENFVEEIWKWKKHSGDTITNQMRRLGNSVDWDAERFTMDDEFSDIYKSFCQAL